MPKIWFHNIYQFVLCATFLHNNVTNSVTNNKSQKFNIITKLDKISHIIKYFPSDKIYQHWQINLQNFFPVSTVKCSHIGRSITCKISLCNFALIQQIYFQRSLIIIVSHFPALEKNYTHLSTSRRISSTSTSSLYLITWTLLSALIRGFVPFRKAASSLDVAISRHRERERERERENDTSGGGSCPHTDTGINFSNACAPTLRWIKIDD